METLALLGSALGLGLVSGIRLYSTVLAVGIGINFGWLDLDPHLVKLNMLGSPYILSAAGFVYMIEFVADKIPWIDSLWDTVHTFIRPVGAALIGATAFGAVDPVASFSSFLLCGSVGFTGHASKVGTRVVANHSPEPFTNTSLSLFEDGFVVGGIWLAVEHPILTLLFVVAFVSVFLLLLPKVVRLSKQGFKRLVSFIQSQRASGTQQ